MMMALRSSTGPQLVAQLRSAAPDRRRASRARGAPSIGSACRTAPIPSNLSLACVNFSSVPSGSSLFLFPFSRFGIRGECVWVIFCLVGLVLFLSFSFLFLFYSYSYSFCPSRFIVLFVFVVFPMSSLSCQVMHALEVEVPVCPRAVCILKV